MVQSKSVTGMATARSMARLLGQSVRIGHVGAGNILCNDFKVYNLENGGPSTNVTLTNPEGEKYYREMKTIRAMELAIVDVAAKYKLNGPTHLYTGQEACAVGISAAIRPDDSIITAYRLHGYAYLKGVTWQAIIAELLGRETGGSKGKGGSMHLYAKSSHFYGGTGIVGSEVPLGVGIALARRHVKADTICVTVYGDGAANQGQVFEALNIAKLWNLPVLFVCENNKKSRQETTSRLTAWPDIYTRCNFMPGIWVDGMDVLAVREATKFAVNYMRSQKGPIVLELDTSYFNGHFCGHQIVDHTKRTPETGNHHEEDPIDMLRHTLTISGLVSEDRIQEIDRSIEKEVTETVNKVTQGPEPDLNEMFTDIYSNEPDMSVRGCDIFSTYRPTMHTK